MKKAKLLACFAALAITASMSAFSVSAATAPDDQIFDANLTAGSATYFTGGNALGIYSGSAGYCYLGTGADKGCLVFDTAASGGYVTSDLGAADKTPLTSTFNPGYKYAVITLKSDDPADSQNATMTIGRTAKPDATGNDADGHTFTDWGITLSTSYQTYTLDLTKAGFDHWGDPGTADFAINQGTATKGKITVKSLLLTNGTSSSSVSTPASSASSSASSTAAVSSSTTTTTSPNTGDTFPIAAVGVTVVAAAAAIFAVSKVSKKK